MATALRRSEDPSEGLFFPSTAPSLLDREGFLSTELDDAMAKRDSGASWSSSTWSRMEAPKTDLRLSHTSTNNDDLLR